MIDRAVQHGVIYVAGAAFFVNDGGQNIIRLAFSAPSHERFAKASSGWARRQGRNRCPRQMIIVYWTFEA